MAGTSAIDSVRDQLALEGDGGIHLGSPATVGGLTLFPLFHNWGAVEYQTQGEAQKGGVIEVTEVGSTGQVGTLLAKNAGQIPVLMVEGEILIGLKQNRVLNTTMLVPPASTLTIPVSCVEAGRWRHRGARVRRSKYSLSAKIRAIKMAGVARSARLSGNFISPQVEVWGGVAHSLRMHRMRSTTMAYTEMEEQRGAEIDDALGHLAPAPGQTGVLAFVGGQPLSLDVFDRPSTLTQLWPELVGSYVGEALVDQSQGSSIDSQQAVDWIHRLSKGEASGHPAVGLGETVFITASDHVVTGLVVDRVPVHIAAWPK